MQLSEESQSTRRWRQTAFIQLAFKEFDQGLGMFSRFVVILDDLAEFTEASMEGCKIRLVVNRRLVHVVKDLLCNQIGTGEHRSLQPTSREPGSRFRDLQNQARERIDGLVREIEWCVMTDPHRGYLAVCRRCIFSLSDGEVEQGKQAKYISKRGVQPVIIDRVVVPHIVQLRN